VSRLWKSELVLRLDRMRCRAEVRSAWRRELQASAEVEGVGPTLIAMAIQALRDQGVVLPKQACLLVSEEQAYLSLLPADTAWSGATPRATAHFAESLGRLDLVVRVAALPGGRWWLAAAIDPTDLLAWQRAVEQEGMALSNVQLGLLADLRVLASRIADRSVLALLRDEGVLLLRLSEGSPVELRWERCDPQAHACIEQRVQAFLKSGEVNEVEPMALLCRTPAQHDRWQRLAQAHGWTLLLPSDALPVEAGT
jgi:hypothetical protein